MKIMTEEKIYEKVLKKLEKPIYLRLDTKEDVNILYALFNHNVIINTFDISHRADILRKELETIYGDCIDRKYWERLNERLSNF